MTKSASAEVLPSHHPEKAGQELAERSSRAMLAIQDCVEITAKKLGGVPVFRGTRFSIPQFLGELADSEAIAEIADNFEVDEAAGDIPPSPIRGI